MTKAMDRVKAAEAKYEAMAATAEKLEATLKELKSTAKSCQWSIDGPAGAFEQDVAVLGAIGARNRLPP